MKTTKWMMGAAFGAVMAGAAMTPAAAQDQLFMPLLTYRTGAFAGSGVSIADGMRDYLEMINQRDGGIGGVKIGIEECETGYDTKKGVECYEALKSKNPLVVSPYSTGIALQIIPRAAVDKVVVLSMAYGLSASADGSVFPWIFNPPATYWDGASVMVSYMASTSSRARSSASSTSTRPSARSRSRCSKPWPSSTASS
jgi:branched-chain amino acid transport system substrate-binding protein